LAAHVGGVAEIIADEQTGWLFDPADALQAVAILERLIQEPMQCRRAGDRARQRTEQQFPMTKMVTDYLKIYRPLLTENR
jgi:glycosyltransferase involved in cell wall biosynthesis